MASPAHLGRDVEKARAGRITDDMLTQVARITDRMDRGDYDLTSAEMSLVLICLPGMTAELRARRAVADGCCDVPPPDALPENVVALPKGDGQ
jgi:hypothetical protein